MIPRCHRPPATLAPSSCRCVGWYDLHGAAAPGALHVLLLRAAAQPHWQARADSLRLRVSSAGGPVSERALHLPQGTCAAAQVAPFQGTCAPPFNTLPASDSDGPAARPPAWAARESPVEGEWLGRMFRAGRHARYMPWSPEERGPESGAPHLAWGPLPAPSKSPKSRCTGLEKEGF